MYTASAFPSYKHSPEGDTAANSFIHPATDILLILRPTEGRRLSWPSWLTHSSRLAHEVVTRQPWIRRRPGKAYWFRLKHCSVCYAAVVIGFGTWKTLTFHCVMLSPFSFIFGFFLSKCFAVFLCATTERRVKAVRYFGGNESSDGRQHEL